MQAVAAVLEADGFQVTHKSNLTREQLVDALAAFADEAADADWALLYFAGHGIEMDGDNYLVPVDARLATDTSVQFEAVPLDRATAAVKGAHKLRIVIFDACRANPFATTMRLSVASRGPSRGLAPPPEPRPGMLIVYSAKDGEVAADGDGANSPFAAGLVKELAQPGIEIRRVFDLVRDDVIDATIDQQHPFTYGSLSGRQDFYFETGS
ncbi:MAG: caspase family protein [Roseiarcus sp.]